MIINTEILTKEKTQKYISQIIHIEKETSEELGISYGNSWVAKNFLMNLPGKWIFSSISIIDNRLAGYLIMTQWNNNIHGHRMAIASDFKSIKKVKIAQSLYRETEVNARKHMIKYATAIVPKDNIATQKFYLRENFKKLTNDDLSWFIEGRNIQAHTDGDILVDIAPVKGEPSRSFVFRYNYAN
jgi:ribosomal protein S18 acetylase RimI-like enzyme